jgi:hypothetical protein
MKATKKPGSKTDAETLKSLQQIASRGKTNANQKLPTEGIQSSAEQLAQHLNTLYANILAVANQHHVSTQDIIDELRRRQAWTR